PYPLLLLEHRPHAADDLAGTQAVSDDTLQDGADPDKIWRFVVKPAQPGVAARYDRMQRLVDLVRDRGGHFSHRCQLRDARELRALGSLPRPRGRELGEHAVEAVGHAADLVLSLVVGAEAVILGLLDGEGDSLEPAQRPDDVPMCQGSEAEAKGGKGADQAEVEAHPSGEGVDAPLQ